MLHHWGGDSQAGFYNHTEIKTVTFEDDDNITALSANVFNGCTGLQSFNIPTKVTTINNNAFRGCTALAFVTIPANTISIGTYAFYGCLLNDITWSVGSNQVVLNSYAFSHSAITDTVYAKIIDRNFKSNAYLFEYCNNLHNITVPRTSNYMFQYCTGLLSANLTDEDGGHATGTCLFRGCTALTTVTMADTITTIGDNAFYGCNSLVNVTLPNALTKINGSAFQGCTSLQTISLPSTITSLNSSAFQGCTNLTNITLGADWNCACSFSAVTSLTEVSLAAMLVSLADLTDSTAKTLTLGSTNLNKLTAEEKLVALNKNWNLA